MTEEQYLTCDDPWPMLQFLTHPDNVVRLGDWQLRWYALACRDLVSPGPVKDLAVLAMETFPLSSQDEAEGWASIRDATGPLRADILRDIAGNPWQWPPLKECPLCKGTARVVQTRNIGVPFLARRLPEDLPRREAEPLEVVPCPHCKAKGVVLGAVKALGPYGMAQDLGKMIWLERSFDLMPILGDALEDMGCRDAEVLNHCRGPGPHVVGCWVLQWLLPDSTLRSLSPSEPAGSPPPPARL